MEINLTTTKSAVISVGYSVGLSETLKKFHSQVDQSLSTGTMGILLKSHNTNKAQSMETIIPAG